MWVSDSVTRRVDDGDRAALLRDVERMPFPTFLVVAPFLSEDDIVSDEDRLALLRDGLGKDGLYIVSDDRGQIVDATAFGVQLPMRAHDITQAAYWDFDRDDPALPKLEYILALARGEPRMPRAQRAAIPPSEGGPMPTPYGEDEESSSAGFGFAILGVFLFGTALSATGLERRRRRRLSRGRRHAGSLPAGNTRERAVGVHAKLAREIARKRKPDDRALDLEVAASMALDRKGKPIDDLGALVLAERGREVLKGKERDRCYFDPRHAGLGEAHTLDDRPRDDLRAGVQQVRQGDRGRQGAGFAVGRRPSVLAARDGVGAHRHGGAAARHARRARGGRPVRVVLCHAAGGAAARRARCRRGSARPRRGRAERVAAVRAPGAAVPAPGARPAADRAAPARGQRALRREGRRDALAAVRRERRRDGPHAVGDRRPAVQGRAAADRRRPARQLHSCSKLRLDRDFEVPFEIEYGPRGEETPKTIVPRLRAVFQIAADSEAARLQLSARPPDRTARPPSGGPP